MTRWHCDPADKNWVATGTVVGQWVMGIPNPKWKWFSPRTCKSQLYIMFWMVKKYILLWSSGLGWFANCRFIQIYLEVYLKSSVLGTLSKLHISGISSCLFLKRYFLAIFALRNWRHISVSICWNTEGNDSLNSENNLRWMHLATTSQNLMQGDRPQGEFGVWRETQTVGKWSQQKSDETLPTNSRSCLRNKCQTNQRHNLKRRYSRGGFLDHFGFGERGILRFLVIWRFVCLNDFLVAKGTG